MENGQKLRTIMIFKNDLFLKSWLIRFRVIMMAWCGG